MGKKLTLVAAAMVALAVLLAVVLGFKGWEADAFAAEALQRLEDEAGWALEAESARLVPFEGLTLEGVSGTSRIGGGTAEVVAERVVLEHRPGALLSGRLELERLLLVRPRLTLAEPAPPQPVETPVTPPEPVTPRTATPPPKPPEPEPEPPYEGPVRFELASVAIEDGALIVGQAGADSGLRIEGLHLTLDAPKVAPEQRKTLARALTSTGSFRAASVTLPVGELQDVDAALRIEEGRLLIPELRFANALGDFRADASLMLGTSPLRHQVKLQVEPLDLHALFDSPERELFGEASLELQATGIGATREGLSGQGRVTVSPGRLPSFPILNHLEAGLRRVSLHQAEHGPVVARFALAGGRLEFEPFRFSAGELQFEGDGAVGLDGELDLEVTLSAAPGAVSLRGVPDDIVDLMTIERGRLSIPVLVSGTTDRPRARADSAKLAERARARGLTVNRAALDAQLDELFGLEG